MTGPSVLAGKRDAVRAGLARVAIDLFARDGFEAVTVEGIARAAGISPRTFFRYFPTKDDIVLELGSHLQDRLLTAFTERPEREGAVEALHRAYVATSTAVATTEWHAWVDDGGTGDPAMRIDAALTALEEGLRALAARRSQ